MNIRAQIKSWLSLNQYTYEKLTNELTVKTGKKYTVGSLNAKLSRGTLHFSEVEAIADILGYKVNFIRKDFIG